MRPFFLATKKVQSPSDIPPSLDGDKTNPVSKRGGGYVIILEKIKKSSPHFPFWVIEQFWSTSNGVGVSNGN
jgi:hypothetical protein